MTTSHEMKMCFQRLKDAFMDIFKTNFVYVYMVYLATIRLNITVYII